MTNFTHKTGPNTGPNCFHHKRNINKQVNE